MYELMKCVIRQDDIRIYAAIMIKSKLTDTETSGHTDVRKQ